MSTQDTAGNKKLKIIKIKKGANLNRSAIASPSEIAGTGAGEYKSIPKISLRKIKLSSIDKQ